MAPPAQARSELAQAERPLFPDISDSFGDDWVSLILNDVGTDAEADNPVSLSSLPLPDLDDLDFTDLDEPVSENGVCSSLRPGHSSHPSLRFDPSEVLQNIDFCPTFYHCDDSELYGFRSHSEQAKMSASPKHAHFSNFVDEIAESQSPEVELSSVNQKEFDVEANIPPTDSCSDTHSISFLVSDLCSLEASCTEIRPCNSENAVSAEVAETSIGSAAICTGTGKCDTQEDKSVLQSSSACQNASCVSVMSDILASKRETTRKRKLVERMSRSTTPDEGNFDGHQTSFEEIELKDEDEERRKARLMRNRESAQLSRQRKKIYVDELEEKIKTMASTIAELNNTVSLISAENVNLRRQLGMLGPQPGQVGGLSGANPWMGTYPNFPMLGNRFLMPGSQVPLVPIPRLKSQQITTVKKSRKSKADSQGKDNQEKPKKTKKVAGVAAAGLFFFMFILLPVNFPMLGFRPRIQGETEFGPTTHWHMETSGGLIRAGGRVLTGLDENSSFHLDGEGSHLHYNAYGGEEKVMKESNELETCNRKDMDKRDQMPGYIRNDSIPLVATLFVPRNDQLVRIDGNLIINSVLAGNKAADPSNYSTKQIGKFAASRERSLALKTNLKAVSLKAGPDEKGALVELQRALAGKWRFNVDGGDVERVKQDNSSQQWFVEDFTGPIFSSGLCTEVFQFETSSASPTSGSGSGSRVQDANRLQESSPRRAGRSVTYAGKSKSYAVPLPPVGHKAMLNSTSSDEEDGYGSDTGFPKQKHSSSSIVVSLLTGPELGEHSKLTGGQKLSRIFVVVLIDSIKYVTYSCMLPSTTAKAHYEVVVA